MQKNFTTPRQSEKLLKLGVPAKSADMYTCLGFENLIWIRNTKNELNEDFFDLLINGKAANIPIWSVGRLIEIMSICGKFIETQDLNIENISRMYIMDIMVTDKAIEDIEILINQNRMDFTKI